MLGGWVGWDGQNPGSPSDFCTLEIKKRHVLSKARKIRHHHDWKKYSSQSFLRQPLNFLWFEGQRARIIRVITYILSLFTHQSKKKKKTTRKAWASLIFFFFCSFFQSPGRGVNDKWIGQIPAHQKETDQGLKCVVIRPQIIWIAYAEVDLKIRCLKSQSSHFFIKSFLQVVFLSVQQWSMTSISFLHQRHKQFLIKHLGHCTNLASGKNCPDLTHDPSQNIWNPIWNCGLA